MGKQARNKYKFFFNTQKYGSLYGYREGGLNVLVISDPAMVHAVFVKHFDTIGERRVCFHALRWPLKST